MTDARRLRLKRFLLSAGIFGLVSLIWPAIASGFEPQVEVAGSIILTALMVWSVALAFGARARSLATPIGFTAFAVAVGAVYALTHRGWIAEHLPVIEEAIPQDPFLALLTCAAVVAAVPLVATLAARFGGGQHEKLMREHGSAVAQVLGISFAALREHGKLSRGRKGSLILAPVPPAAVLHLDQADALMAVVMEDYSLDSSSNASQVVFVPVTYEVRTSREVLRESGGLLVGISDAADDATRPHAVTWHLPVDTSPTKGERLAALASQRGMHLVDFLPYEGRAIVAQLDPTVVAVRGRFAELLRVRPWEIEVEVDQNDEDTVVGVRLLRAPSPNIDPERRHAIWRSLLGVIPGATAGWRIEEDLAGQVTFTFGVPRALPQMAALVDLAPATVDPSTWDRLPLGVGAEEQTVALDLNLGPHAVYVGPTGSGKSVGLLTHAVSALAGGHQLAIIDPTKAGLDFLALRPHCSVWADTLATAEAAITAIYAEVTRRKAILQAHGAVKWSALPDTVRETENVGPLTAIIDEAGSLVLQDQSAKALPKDHPMKEQIEAENGSRAAILSTIARIAREARFAGIHLVLALQRPDASILSGEMRSNLTSVVQLSAPGRPLSREALGMVFPGETAHFAAEALSELDDGRSRGLAVAFSDGGELDAFRVAYAPVDEIPALLADRGVPAATLWALDAAPATEPAAVSGLWD